MAVAQAGRAAAQAGVNRRAALDVQLPRLHSVPLLFGPGGAAAGGGLAGAPGAGEDRRCSRAVVQALPLALPFLHSQTCFLTPSIAVNSTSGPPRLRAQGRLVMRPQVQSACLGDRMFAAMAACLQAGHSKASMAAVVELVGNAPQRPCMQQAVCCL